MCRNDASCAGIECGPNRGCLIWNDGYCGTLEKQLRVNENYSTCMKYDEGDNLLLYEFYIGIMLI